MTFTEADILGRGSYGDVFKGERAGTEELVAVKRIVLTRNDRQEKYLQRELTALSHINHPNVVKLYDVKRTTSCLYLYMEYCSGRDMEEYLSHHDLPLPTMFRFIQQSAGAVLFMHTIRPVPFIHRDLKPGNFLIDVDNDIPSLKVADFGFARTTSDSEGNISGTYCGLRIIWLLKYDQIKMVTYTITRRQTCIH